MGFFGVKFGSSVAVVQGPPGTPADLAATATGPTTIDLTWTLSTDYPREKGVRVYSSADGSTYRIHGTDLPAGSTALSVGDLVPGQTYYFKVAALGTETESPPSAPAFDTTDSDTPPVAEFSLESTSVLTGSSIIATNLSTDYTSSAWYVDDVLVSTEDSPTLLFDTAGDHVVTLVVSGPGGTDTSDPQTVTVTDPATPTVTSVVGLSDRFEVNFDTTVTGHDGFEFHTATHDDVPATYSSGDGTNQLIFLRDSGTTYQGESYHADYSPGNVQAVSGGAALGAFTGYAVDNQSTDQPPAPTLPTLVSLTIPVAGNTLVLVASEAVTGTAAPTVSASGGAATATYLSGSGTDTITYSLSRTVLQGETATGAMSGGLFDSDGHPLASFSGVSVDNQSEATAAAPGQPTGLDALGVTDVEINLTWDLADAADTSIEIQRSAAGADSWSTVATPPGGYEMWVDDGPLDPATSYDYRVRASNAAGDSSWSATATGTTKDAAHNSANDLQAFSAASAGANRIRISYTAPTNQVGSTQRLVVYRSDDGGATYRKAGVRSPLPGQSYTWDDYPLPAGSTYHYKARVLSSATYGAFSSASATTDAQGDLPLWPTGLAKSETSATQCVLSWADTNGGAAAYEIWTAPLTAAGVSGATWTRVAVTAAGATSYTLPTTAGTPRFWRMRAAVGSDYSEYTNPDMDLTVWPPTAAGSPQTVHIGPGRDYEDFGDDAAAALHALTPGSTVYVHRAGTADGAYHQKLVLRCRGTSLLPIAFVGVDDGDGYPVVDGLGATTAPSFYPAGDLNYSTVGLVLLQALASDVYGHIPGHLVFRNLTFRNAHASNSPNTYVDHLGATRTYSTACAAVYVVGGTDVLFDNCEFLNCGNGLFAAWNGSARRYCADLTMRGCYLAGNCTVGSGTQHQTYIEGVRVTYEGCWYGPPRTGGGGTQLKDRGLYTVIRYNRIDPHGRLLDLVEIQNAFDPGFVSPGYDSLHCYGNVLRSSVGNPIQYGGDSSNPTQYRHGQFRFYHNTLLFRADPSQSFRTNWFFMKAPAGAAYAVDNVWLVRRDTPTAGDPYPQLFSDGSSPDTSSCGRFGPNFVSKAWVPVQSGYTFSGKAHGTEHFVTNAANEPDFVDVDNGDLRILEGTASDGAGGRLPSDWPAPDLQYAHPRSTEAREAWGAGSTLGYSDASPDETPPVVSGTPTVSALGNLLRVPLSEAYAGSSGFTLTVNGSPVALTHEPGQSTATVLAYTTASVVLTGQTCLLDYAAGDVTDVAGNALAGFSGLEVANNSLTVSEDVPQVASVSQAASLSGLSLDIPKPSNVAEGDLLVAAVVPSGGVEGATTGPDVSWANVLDAAATVPRLTLWWKVADATDADAGTTAYTWNSTALRSWAGQIYRVTGADTADPFGDVQSAGQSSNLPDLTAPAATTPVDDCLVLRVAGGLTPFDAVPASPHVELATTNQSGAKACCASAAMGLAAAGDAGTGTFSFTSIGRGTAATVVIKPAP